MGLVQPYIRYGLGVIGKLFTTEFLQEGIKDTEFWKETSDSSVASFKDQASQVLAGLPAGSRENEDVTEDHVIKPILQLLGWNNILPQQNLSATGRGEIPDLLLFENSEQYQLAFRETAEHRRYRFGLTFVESKRWDLPLDRPDHSTSNQRAPSSQMLWYIRRAAIMSDQKLRWGVLTNGRIWRLYWSEARSIADDFLELDLAVLLGDQAVQLDMLDPSHAEPQHFLKVFLLLFGQEAFQKKIVDIDNLSFHELALREGRIWERRIAEDLGRIVFDHIFPEVGKVLIEHDPGKPSHPGVDYLEEIRKAALVFLYRLLFIFHAEDRRLLPIQDPRYSAYSLRQVRKDIADAQDQRQSLSQSATRFHDGLITLYRAIAEGDSSIGLPAYNGGLFDPQANPVLERIRLSDAVLAPLIDSLSREEVADGSRKWINYRDLSVQHLGSIYERILEYAFVLQSDGKPQVQLNRFARKGSGSYYTHDDLVKLIIHETVQPLIDELVTALTQKIEEGIGDGSAGSSEWEIEVARLDPALAILELKICDPAMGSGHFLVSLVDYLADHVLEQMASAAAAVNNAAPDILYVSPLAERIGDIRRRILSNAETDGWALDRGLLDDRHLVRRIILKRVIYGVDKNAMAVELAKVALWLHTFTVGAPLSFLDHHLKCGDSLFGEWFGTTYDQVVEHAGLFMQSNLANINVAAEEMTELSELTDADLEEVQRSKQLHDQIETSLNGIHRLMDVTQAGRWLRTQSMTSEDEYVLNHTLDAFIDTVQGEEINPQAVLTAAVTSLKSRKHAKKVEAAINNILHATDTVRPLHWELAFPTIWRPDASIARGDGGFDAVIGNPPWDRMKLQEVEWFATRKPEVAMQARAADRQKLITKLAKNKDPLWDEFLDAQQQAETATAYARQSGQYPLLSGGDINIYSLFVERAQALVKPSGIVGLLVPSGIASDLSARQCLKTRWPNSAVSLPN